MRSSILIALCALIVVLSVFTPVSADTWAVLVAGSNTYGNYRHQADVCHAYHILIKNGVKADHIITFAYDDIANNTANPYPGKIFNKPTDKGVAGVDVYGGCKIDYTGGAVLPEVYVDVITGVVNKNFTGPVLKSGAGDNVFLNFVDHGSPGTIYFPGFIPFQGIIWNEALKTMYSKKMYSKMVIYLEACEAGSIFDKYLPDNIEVYATTAANPTESSWGTYCPGETPGSIVDGVDLQTCLGDLYSVNWMQDQDKNVKGETLEQQFKNIVTTTNLSHPQQYGTTTWTNLPTTDFLGSVSSSIKSVIRYNEEKVNTGISSRDINIHILYRQYLNAKPRSVERRNILKKLDLEIDHRQFIDDFFYNFAVGVVGLTNHLTSVEELLEMPYTPIIHNSCMIDVDATYRKLIGYSEYSTQYAGVFINACRSFNNPSSLNQLISQTAANLK